MTTEDAEIRQRCADRRAQLDVPTPFDLDAFVAQLAQQRGRPLQVSPLDALATPDTPCGVWIGTDAADHVFVEAHTSAFHRDHIVCHELAHMLLEHDSAAPTLGESYASRLLPNLSPDMLRRVLGRTAYTDRQEREAELLATLILGRTRPPRPVADRAASAAVSNTLRRLDEAIGGL